MATSGLAVVDKPGGMTSHDVVARVRRLAGTRKVGHAGTLDPMATGVLVLGIERATRLLGHLLLADKRYDATIRLGIATDTDDAQGQVVTTCSAAGLDDAAIRAVLEGFVGDLEQVPSSVSAIKVDGHRAYKLVREGLEVDLPARAVRIESIDVHDLRHEGETVDLDISVSCSTGTYIRAIARDLGAELGVGGHLTALRRTSVGPFTLDDTAGALADLTDLEIVPMGTVARRVFDHVEVGSAAARDISFGRALELMLPNTAQPVALLDSSGNLLALYRQDGPVAVPVAVLV